jgi:hypothetical protein
MRRTLVALLRTTFGARKSVIGSMTTSRPRGTGQYLIERHGERGGVSGALQVLVIFFEG